MPGCMIPDDELAAVVDKVTVWVASPPGPRDVWSLADAVAWAMSSPDRKRITLFRPPSPDLRAAWVEADQIERIAIMLAGREVAQAG